MPARLAVAAQPCAVGQSLVGMVDEVGHGWTPLGIGASKERIARKGEESTGILELAQKQPHFLRPWPIRAGGHGL